MGKSSTNWSNKITIGQSIDKTICLNGVSSSLIKNRKGNLHTGWSIYLLIAQFEKLYGRTMVGKPILQNILIQRQVVTRIWRALTTLYSFATTNQMSDNCASYYRGKVTQESCYESRRWKSWREHANVSERISKFILEANRNSLAAEQHHASRLFQGRTAFKLPHN